MTKWFFSLHRFPQSVIILAVIAGFCQLAVQDAKRSSKWIQSQKERCLLSGGVLYRESAAMARPPAMLVGYHCYMSAPPRSDMPNFSRTVVK
jgi:hypothetical protein